MLLINTINDLFMNKVVCDIQLVITTSDNVYNAVFVTSFIHKEYEHEKDVLKCLESWKKCKTTF